MFNVKLKLLCIPIFGALATIGLGTERLCHWANGLAKGTLNSEESPQEFQIVKSFGLLRTLNNHVFGNQTHYSEVVTKWFHFFYQYHFLKLSHITSQSAKLGANRSPWVKQLNLTITAKPSDLPAFGLRAQLAKAAAAKDLANLVFNRGESEMNLLREGMVSDSTLLTNSRFAFGEGSKSLPSISDGTVDHICSRLQRFFKNQRQFRREYFNAYGIGIGPSSFEAHLAAKESQNASKHLGGVIIFNGETYRLHLDTVAKLRDEVETMFTRFSNAERGRAMRLFRNQMDSPNPERWPDQLHNVMEKLTGSNEASKKEDAYRIIAEYLRMISNMDYLPEKVVTVPSGVREKFAKVDNPSGVIFYDVAGLGEKNLSRLHDTLPKLVQDFRTFHSALSKVRSQKSKEPTPELDGHFSTFHKTGESILDPSLTYVKSIEQRLEEALHRQGVSEEQYVRWHSGDEGFINVGTGFDMNNVVAEIMRDPVLRQSLHIAFAENTGKKSVSLWEARVFVGPLAVPIKQLRNSGGEGGLVAKTKDWAPPENQASVMKFDGGQSNLVPLSRTEAKSLSEVTGWTLH